MASKRVLVTGGGGFVGKALCKRLKSEGYTVISLARGSYPELQQAGIETVQCDLSSDSKELDGLLNGVDTVFHVAAKVKMWGRWEDFYNTNVLGTKRLLDAASSAGVKKFIYTSSPSVVADGTNLRGVDETYPYPDSYEAFYPKSKAMAEKLVVEAHNKNGMKTAILRPHLIWGPGDTNLIPTIINKAKSGDLVQIGDGENLVDLCFIDDCVEAHMCSMKSLEENPNAGGKAYFISQGQPVKLWDWINKVLVASGLQKIERKVSFGFAHFLAGVFEFFAKIMPGDREPRLTKFLVSEMATDHYFDISLAAKELNFKPRYNIEDAMKVTFGG